MVSALKEAFPATADDLWEQALIQAVELLTKAYGENAGVQIMLRLCRMLDEPQRLAAAHVLLRTDR